jgi:hypothetical protein
MIYFMRRLLLLPVIFLTIFSTANGQGCVAVKNLAGFGQFASLGFKETPDTWSLDINNRYFAAWNVYQGTKKIGIDGNYLYEYAVNFELLKDLKNGWSLGFDLPIASNKTISTNNDGLQHPMYAFGVSDIRFTVYKWLFDTQVPRKGNIQVGLGLKFPTGNYHTLDYWYYGGNPDTKALVPDNVAIQLGDGGTGITTAINAFYIFNRTVSIYANLFYLISPANTNGVLAYPPGALPPSVDSLNKETTNNVNSVPDNYTLRAGANLTFDRLVFTAGLRFEGAPAHDLIGEDDGLRRVGHIFSIEPGMEYKFKKAILYAFVTVPVERQTIETVPDERQQAITGVPFITPGHFANIVYYLGYTFTF